MNATTNDSMKFGANYNSQPRSKYRKSHYHKRSSGIAILGVSLLALTGCGDTQAGVGADFPEDDVNVIAASAPGGSLDTLARIIQESTTENDLIDAQMDVENLGAGGGNVARTETVNRPNDGRTVVIESNRIFLNPLTGTTDLDVEDFTPIANMVTDYMVWAVLPDSEWESASEVIDAVTENPQAVNFGVGTVPSDDQFNILAPMQQSGVDDLSTLSITTFDGGADLKANLLSGDVDIASTSFSELSQDAAAGDVRFLVVSAGEPQGGALEGVPTWQEEGIDYTLDKWLGVFGPADMPEEAVAWWVDHLEEVTTTETWAEQMDTRQLNADFLSGEEFEELVSSQRADAEELIALIDNGDEG